MGARIVVAVFLNVHLLSALNGNSDEPVLRVVGVDRGLLALNLLNKITVEVVFVSNASFRNKLVQLVVGIADDLAVYCFCQAVAVAVVGVLSDGRAVIVGHGLLYQSVKCVVLILNGAGGSSSGFFNLYALSGCSKGIFFLPKRHLMICIQWDDLNNI